MTNLIDLTIAEARDKLKSKEIKSVELTQAYIDAMGKHKSLNAYIADTPEIALKMAKKADENIANGKGGIMEGIPVGVKDLFCTNGVISSSCSKILTGFKPPYESTVTEKLFASGAVMLGKTNMDEFAMGSTNATSCYGPAINPWKRKDGKQLTPGGSSGGSSAAVAARICAGALGSDTGGSIRQPASFTGTVGIKPTYGRCSRFGMIAFASSLDQAGPITRTVRDAAIMLEAISGFDPKDSTSENKPVPNYEKAITGNIKGLKVGIPKEYDLKGLSTEIKALWEKGAEWLKSAGAEIIEVNLPHAKYALPVYYIIAPAEASSNLARFDGVRYGFRAKDNKFTSIDDMYNKTRGHGFGAEVKRRIMIGTYVLSAGYYDAYYTKAQKVKKLIKNDFSEAYKKVDVILAPTTPSAAFALDEKPSDPVEMYLNDVFTVTANLAEIPAISVPAGLSSEGLPLGLQLMGRHFDEETLFRVAGVLEEAADFKGKPV